MHDELGVLALAAELVAELAVEPDPAERARHDRAGHDHEAVAR